jgi:hypothetical protein
MDFRTLMISPPIGICRVPGPVFLIAGFNDLGMAELNIQAVTGRVGETIWVEPDFLEPIGD